MEQKPILMVRGSRVIDTARLIHKDMTKYSQYSRLWRQGPTPGTSVGRSFELVDGDTLEIHFR